MAESVHIGVTCPFCGLLCDDLTVVSNGNALVPKEHGCAKAQAGFGAPAQPAGPLLDGQDAALDAAVARAAGILRASRLPVYAGLGTDVAGMRELLDLAERTGGALDHMHGEAMARNALTLQDSGWMVTTLTEVRNRVDLLVLAGTDAVSRAPRFFERVVWNPETMFGADTGAREVVYLGTGLDTGAGHAPDGRPPTVIPCDPARLGEVALVLRALLAGRPVGRMSVAGVAVDELQALAARMQQARYGVLAWDAATLDSEITVQTLAELVRDLNRETRFSGLPLGGDEGSTTAAQVCTWLTGYPLRTGFGRGYPELDARRNAAAALLATGADVLLWVSAYSDTAPPRHGAATIVLGRPGMRFERPPAVYIPVGTPGLDHAGQLFRMEGTVALPLHRLRDAGLPEVAAVVRAIRDAL